MSAITKVLDCIFRFQSKIQTTIKRLSINYGEQIGKAGILFMFAAIVVLCVCVFLSEFIALINLSYMLMFLYFLSRLFTKSLKTITTVSGFFGTGLTVVFFFGVVGCIFVIDKLYNIIDYRLLYCVCCMLLVLLWSFYSTLCNVTVSTLCNAILAGIVGIAFQAKTIFLELFSSEINKFFKCVPGLKKATEYSGVEIVNQGFVLILFPVFFMLSVGTIMCAIKRYWLKKSNYKDIERI